MSASGWWARKLGVPQAQPTSTPDTWNLPRHAQPTPAHQPSPPASIPQYEAPVVTENGQIHAVDAIARWRGGDGTRTETATCPNCGSSNYFSRTRGQGRRIGLINANGQACSPAAVCYECGYNGLFEAFGGAFSDLAGG